MPDHFTPNKDIKSAEQVKFMTRICKRNEDSKLFEVGQMV